MNVVVAIERFDVGKRRNSASRNTSSQLFSIDLIGTKPPFVRDSHMCPML